jgi:predicted dehydrogenase
VRDELFSIFNGEVQSQQNFPTHHRLYYGQYALDTLKAWQEGREPIADLNDLYKAMRVVDKIYSSKETLRLGKDDQSERGEG